MNDDKLEFLRGTIDVLILKSLAWEARHGYAISSFIREHSGEALLLEEGTLYPALWRLETKGMLQSEWGLSENNRKAKFYRLTPRGRRHLQRETTTWHAYAAAVSKVLAVTQPNHPLAEQAG